MQSTSKLDTAYQTMCFLFSLKKKDKVKSFDHYIKNHILKFLFKSKETPQKKDRSTYAHFEKQTENASNEIILKQDILTSDLFKNIFKKAPPVFTKVQNHETAASVIHINQKVTEAALPPENYQTQTIVHTSIKEKFLTLMVNIEISEDLAVLIEIYLEGEYKINDLDISQINLGEPNNIKMFLESSNQLIEEYSKSTHLKKDEQAYLNRLQRIYDIIQTIIDKKN